MTNEHRRILVVDDEPQITRVLRTTLSSQGYDIRVANDGEMALELMKNWSPHVVITDLAMPNLDGVGLCRQVRQMSQVPIIVLSVRGQDRSKVEALDAGADDYVTKPFSMNELLARIRAQLRRSPAAEEQAGPITAGDFSIDLDARSVKVVGREVHLTPKEFDLLVYLARRPGKVVTHRTLLAAIWGPNSTEQTEYLRVFGSCARRLRLILPRQNICSPSPGLGTASNRDRNPLFSRSPDCCLYKHFMNPLFGLSVIPCPIVVGLKNSPGQKGSGRSRVCGLTNWHQSGWQSSSITITRH
jgi:two-component system, OmpR family, KDP operon response regulator KdpE